MEITVKNLQKKLPIRIPQIVQLTKIILRRQKLKKTSLSLTFVSAQRIKSLNKKYLSREYTTDVLAFDLRDGTNISRKKIKEIFGEVIISTDAVRKNASIYKQNESKELALYIVHGILHLLGYDDHKPSDIKKMRAKEEEVIKYLGKKVERLFK